MYKTTYNLLLAVILCTILSFACAARNDPTCKNGILRGNVCCHRSCRTCGTPCFTFCSFRTPDCWFSWLRSRRCCSRHILASPRRCSKTVAPCVMDKVEPPLYMAYQVQEDYVPIIGYHQIGGRSSKLRTTIRRFENQVEYLTNKVGCNWITMEKLSEFIAKKEKIPTKTCVMTFDDGTTYQYHNALCTLNEYKVPATYYLITSFISTHRYYLTWEEVEKLHKMGHDMEAHTKTHAHLSRLNYTEQEKEILGCKKDLEARGYPVRTFSYPYGEYNDDTLEIVRKSDYVLVRDTRQDNRWRNPKPTTINQNPDYLLHFFYIRPEHQDGADLWKRIKYTGWWQFEDNYKIVRGSARTIGIRATHTFLSSDTSHACIQLSRRNEEISTQFITKYEGGFTLHIVARNATVSPGFKIKVDGVPHNVHPSGDEYRYKYYGFYVNINKLSGGVHVFNVINTSGYVLFLDKFSLYSNVSQDFQESMYYKSCDPLTDDYCRCEW